MYPKPSRRAAQRSWGEGHSVPRLSLLTPPDKGHTGDGRTFSWERGLSPEPWHCRHSWCPGLALRNTSAMWVLFWEEFGGV